MARASQNMNPFDKASIQKFYFTKIDFYKNLTLLITEASLWIWELSFFL